MVDDIKIQNYENLTSYLKMILEFYANSEIYKTDKISKDVGFMAKKGLKQIENITEQNNNLTNWATNPEDSEMFNFDVNNLTEKEINETIKQLKINFEFKNKKNENISKIS